MKSVMENTDRRSVIKTVSVTTAVFVLLVFALVFTVKALPEVRRSAAERALENGNYDRVYSLIEKMDDDTASLYKNKCDYCLAVSKMNAGEWEEASELFRTLGAYEDSAELSNRCIYSLGEYRLSCAEWDEAEAVFHSILAYSDAAEREKEAEYKKASELESENDSVSAFLIFDSLDGYLDSADRALELAKRLVGERNLEKARAFAKNLSDDDIARRKELAEFRDRLRPGTVDTGFYHTVALKADGTVLACGDNSCGQCDVGSWKNVKEIAAGAYHTVALLEDGTVCVTGRDSEGQGGVSDWTEIEHIAAADYATFGLKKDGTVLYCGYYDYYMLPEWTGITRIAAGTYSVAGLRGGEALISHVTARDESLTGLVDIAVTTGFAIGLREDGSVVSGQTELDWDNIVAVCAGTNCCLGLTSEGTVRAHFFRPGDAVDMSQLKDVVAFSAAADHFAFVTEGGAVIVLGDNSFGQAETDGWNLLE